MEGFNYGGQIPAHGNEKKILCGCGYGKATHTERISPLTGKKELVEHVLGEGSCCRKVAVGNEVPKNFRMEVWTSYEGTNHEKTFLTEVCEVNGQTITKYTLTDQRGYTYKEEFDVWSIPRKSGSVNSLGDEW